MQTMLCAVQPSMQDRLSAVWHIETTSLLAMMGLCTDDEQSAGCLLSSDMYCMASFSQMCQQRRIAMQSRYERNP